MIISFATANLYHIPFPEALEIIREAGFDSIELDGYWSGGDSWEAAQHIKDYRPKEVLKMVEESGLHIVSFHDMGGVIDSEQSSVISSLTYEYLENSDIPCYVFHTPHKKTLDEAWWDRYRETAIKDLRDISKDRLICIENMQKFDGYIVPLLDPVEMRNFSVESGIYVNMDTSHYGLEGTKLHHAAESLKDRVRTIHLSDYAKGRNHALLGHGDLDLKGMFQILDPDKIYSVTVECCIPRSDCREELVGYCKEAYRYTQNLY